jgi:hypothetical protein
VKTSNSPVQSTAFSQEGGDLHPGVKPKKRTVKPVEHLLDLGGLFNGRVGISGRSTGTADVQSKDRLFVLGLDLLHQSG